MGARLRGERIVVVSTAIILGFVAIAILAPFCAPYDPNLIDYGTTFEGPSGAHWLGTDDLGRDVLSRLILGTRAAFVASLVAVGIAVLVGAVLGLTAALGKSAVGGFIMRLTDAAHAQPALVLILGFILVFRPSLTNAAIAIGLVFAPFVIRLVNSEAARVAQLEFVDASRLSGVSKPQIAISHVLPNIAPALTVQVSGYLGLALVVGTGVDFLGLGAQHPTVSWGTMLGRAYEFLPRSNEQLIFPGLAVAILGLAYSFLGDGLARGLSSGVPDTDGGDRFSAGSGEKVSRNSNSEIHSLRGRIVERGAHANAATIAPEKGLRVDHLTIGTRTQSDSVALVDGVSLKVEPGRIVGLVGESGSGKSLVALSIIGLLPDAVRKTSGDLFLNGERLDIQDDSAMRRFRGKRIGIVFQDPMSGLATFRRVGRQIEDVLLTHTDLSARARRQRVEEILNLVGFIDSPKYARMYPFQLSGGQRQRVLIACALAAEPAILIADEATTALDAVSQAELIRLLKRVRDSLGVGILFITHDLMLVESVCDEVAVMYAGRIMEYGTATEVLSKPRHPYTVALLGVIPQLAHQLDELGSIPGRMPEPAKRRNLTCVFLGRCIYETEACHDAPVHIALKDGRWVRCVRVEAVAEREQSLA